MPMNAQLGGLRLHDFQRRIVQIVAARIKSDPTTMVKDICLLAMYEVVSDEDLSKLQLDRQDLLRGVDMGTLQIINAIKGGKKIKSA